MDSVHMIGFSLGAHVAGFAGKRARRGTVKRITGYYTQLLIPLCFSLILIFFLYIKKVWIRHFQCSW